MNHYTAEELLGRWTTDPNDEDSLRTYGRVSLAFRDDGSLSYVIHGDDKDQVMILRYRIEEGMLITDQTSEPREERTPYTITSDGKLVLEYSGTQSRYIRIV